VTLDSQHLIGAKYNQNSHLVKTKLLIAFACNVLNNLSSHTKLMWWHCIWVQIAQLSTINHLQHPIPNKQQYSKNDRL